MNRVRQRGEMNLGMFDWVTWRGREDWQTKDFECNLDRLVILDDGTAVRQRDRGEPKPFPPGEPHGWIYIYASFDDDPNEGDFSKHWVEYRLKFTDGKLVAAIPQSERAERWVTHDRRAGGRAPQADGVPEKQPGFRELRRLGNRRCEGHGLRRRQDRMAAASLRLLSRGVRWCAAMAAAPPVRPLAERRSAPPATASRQGL